MSFAESLCYLLNRKGRDYRETHARRRREQASPARVRDYQRRFGLDGGRLRRYVDDGGSFLQRYDGAFRRYRTAFPRPDHFAGRGVLVIGSGRGVEVLHLTRDRGARFVTGVELDAELCRFSRRMLEDHGVANARIVQADMASVPAVPENSVDVVVSLATFEHIHDLRAVLLESHRVLKPGASLYSEFSPIWRHYYGSHLSAYLPFPWTHLLFSEETVRKTLTRLQGRPHGALYTGLNRMTLEDYRRVVASTPFQVLRFDMRTGSRLKKLLHRLPLLREYFAGSVVLELRK